MATDRTEQLSINGVEVGVASPSERSDKKAASKALSLDELSAKAGERWAREDAKRQAKNAADVKPREPRRARPHHGVTRIKHNPSLGGHHS